MVILKPKLQGGKPAGVNKRLWEIARVCAVYESKVLPVYLGYEVAPKLLSYKSSTHFT